MINKIYKNIDVRYLEILISNDKSIKLTDIESMLREFSNMFKSILPKLVNQEDKYFGLAVEGL